MVQVANWQQYKIPLYLQQENKMLGQQNLSADETKNPPARERKQNYVDVTKEDQHEEYKIYKSRLWTG